MAERGLVGALISSALGRSVAGNAAVAIYANASELIINHNKAEDLLFYVSPTDQGTLDLNTITNQCAIIRRDQIFRLKIGSERTRPSPGYMYANFVSGTSNFGQVNFAQIVETY